MAKEIVYNSKVYKVTIGVDCITCAFIKNDNACHNYSPLCKPEHGIIFKLTDKTVISSSNVKYISAPKLLNLKK